MGTMTAGQITSPITLRGYLSPTYAALFGVSSFGSITGASTTFGVVEGLYYNATSAVAQIVLSNASDPGLTEIKIDSTVYTVTFDSAFGTYWTYTATPTAWVFTNGGNYTWLTPPYSTFTLDAQGGTFGLTGGTATFPIARRLTASGGTFTLTGAATGFNKGFTLDAQGGTYSYTGGAVNFPVTRVVTASGGIFTFTGGSANLNKGRILDAQGGTFSLAGGTVNFPIGHVLAALGGTFSLTGGTAVLSKGRPFAALGGVFTLTGGSAGFPVALKLTADGGVFELTGGEAIMIPFFKTYRFTGARRSAVSVAHSRSSASPRRAVSFSSRR